jgi:uncharacterized membrane protein YhaH (DUF805 family)
MDFQTAIRTVLKDKYATFSGRAARSEYWWFFLFSFVASLILTVIDIMLFGNESLMSIDLIFSLAILVPSIAVGVRRLHDLGRSGWWLLIILIPLIGILILLFFFVQKGTDGPNEHGADPLAGVST